MSIESSPIPSYAGEGVEVEGIVEVKGGEDEAVLALHSIPLVGTTQTISTNIDGSIFWGMSGTIRSAGLSSRRFTDNRVLDNSQVMVSMCELDPNGKPKLGSAPMSILNVAPFNGGVDVAFRIEWNELIPVRFNFIIVN